MRTLSFEPRFILHAHDVEEKEIDECLTWAFGSDFRTIPVAELRFTWNRLHGNLYPIFGTESFESVMIAILDKFREHKKQNRGLK